MVVVVTYGLTVLQCKTNDKLFLYVMVMSLVRVHTRAELS